jgi:hypothetical protein
MRPTTAALSIIERIPQLVAIALTLAAFFAPAAAQDGGSSKGKVTSPVGDWRGSSICQVRPSACHDEEALYHVSRLAAKPGRFSLQADKIVDGKPEMMGVMECSFDSQTSALDCATDRLSLHLVVDGNKMQGAMNHLDGTVVRKIDLRKVGS